MLNTRISVAAGAVAGGFALAAGLIVSIGIAGAADTAERSSAVPATVAGLPSVGVAAQAVGVEPDRPAPAVRSARSIDQVRPATPEVQAIAPVVEASVTPPVATDRLVLVGDSLAGEIAPVLRMATPDKSYVRKHMGGTAPCDWIDVDLEATPSSVVVVTFTGNNLTPCMFDDAGVRLVDEALVEQYRSDVGVLIERATNAGAWVVLVGQPHRDPAFDAEVEVDGINAVYQQYAAALPRVAFVDAGRFVETSAGDYSDRLPCIGLDTDCAADGTTLVRGDGIHFCPVVDAAWCPVYSSGATRFGLGIATAATDPAAFD